MANLFRCGGGRSEASYQNLMDQLIEETTTGPIASFTDGANNIPAKEVICHINPTETGTGEKSPQNPYVIGGFTEANITQQSTIPVTDNAPYLFRQSGGDNNADVYNQETDKLVGASAVVNQTFNYDGGIGKNNGTIEVSNNSLTFTVTNKSTYQYINQPQVFLAGHKVLVSLDVTLSENETVGFEYGGGIGHLTSCTANTKKHIEYIDNFANSANIIYVYLARTAGLSVGATAIIDNFIITDLTAMFGTTIADYIYSLEQATAGSGIAYLRKYGFFTKDYYPYTANTLQSVNTSKHITVTGNLFDIANSTIIGARIVNYLTGEIDNWGSSWSAISSFIPVAPQTQYYIHSKTGFSAGSNAGVAFYDYNHQYISGLQYTSRFKGKRLAFVTPSNAFYMRWCGTTLAVNDCVLTTNPNATAYEPYSAHEYTLPNIDLRGLYKLDASNNLYADGDTLEGDGTKTNNYIYVDLGSLTWNKTSSTQFNLFRASVEDIKTNDSYSSVPDMICPRYVTVCPNDRANKTIYTQVNQGQIIDIIDNDYTDAQTFKASLNGVYLVAKRNTPTTETATGFTNPQTVSKYGTEEYTDERDFPLPVGHETIYLPTGQREYTVPFGQTVYGGELVLHEGQNDKLIPWEYIASYNGEAINEPWVSSMDAYAPGTTPTTGAFVCYPAAVPTETTLPTKTEIKTLLGANNIYHDCNGDTDVTYRANGALYVQEHPITRALMAARPAEQIQEQEEQQEEKEINKSEDNEI